MDETQLEIKANFLDDLFEQASGHSLSSKYREENNIQNSSLTYGEIKFLEFAKLFELFSPTKNKIFYDLGSGTGKACFAAAFLGDFKKSIGIELVPGLYQSSQELKSCLSNGTYNNYFNKLTFINGNFLENNFADADVIFANSTCFDQKLMDDLTAQLNHLKKGSFVTLLTQTIDSKEFELIYETGEIEYSWGNPTTRVYKKT
jgi:SAM-dependent methyltransferase